MSSTASTAATASVTASVAASVTPSTATQSKSSTLVGTPTNVSEPAFEFLLSSILHWVEDQCHREHSKLKAEGQNKAEAGSGSDAGAQSKTEEKEVDMDKNETKNDNEEDAGVGAQTQTKQQQESADSGTAMIAEHAAAKMERLGYDVGYRLSERLAQSKSLIPPNTNNNQPPTPAAVQLEAVKFICKEFWMEVYHKQIDKLQTNHRGVFVLKDMEFKWLKRLPGEQDLARIMAIKILAFPCGLIRGAMANLGIVAVVSCDFLADGRNMSSCSFNIKIKSP